MLQQKDMGNGTENRIRKRLQSHPIVMDGSVAHAIPFLGVDNIGANFLIAVWLSRKYSIFEKRAL